MLARSVEQEPCKSQVVLDDPKDIIARLNADIEQVLQMPEVKARMFDLGNYPVDMSTADLTRFIKQEQELWGPVVRQIIAATPPAQPSNTK